MKIKELKLKFQRCKSVIYAIREELFILQFHFDTIQNFASCQLSNILQHQWRWSIHDNRCTIVTITLVFALPFLDIFHQCFLTLPSVLLALFFFCASTIGTSIFHPVSLALLAFFVTFLNCPFCVFLRITRNNADKFRSRFFPFFDLQCDVSESRLRSVRSDDAHVEAVA